MRSIVALFTFCLISLPSLAHEIPQAVLESQMGIRKDYADIDEVRQYAIYGAHLLIQKLELISSKGDQVKEELNQAHFAEALASVGEMSVERRAYEDLRGQVKNELSSILRNFFQPGLDSRNEDVVEVYTSIMSPYLSFYNDFLFSTLGSTGRAIDSGRQSLVSNVEFYVNMSDGGLANFPVSGAIGKVDEIQAGLAERISVIQDFVSSIQESE
jgi:hypothetical protein